MDGYDQLEQWRSGTRGNRDRQFQRRRLDRRPRLDNTTVEVGGGGAMIGNVLALADLSIVGPGLLGLVVQQDIIADRMSFVGIPAAATTGGLDVQTAMDINLGTVGAEVGGVIPAWSYMDRKIKGECRLKRLWLSGPDHRQRCG